MPRDYRQQLIDEGLKLEAALKRHGYDAPQHANESAFDRIVWALDSANDAGHDVQKLLDAERAKTKDLTSEVGRLRAALRKYEGSSIRPHRWDDRILGYLMERARRDEPTATRSELARVFECSPGALDGVLKRLIDKELVERVRHGTYRARKAAE